ncbi:MAG: hypothetical protein N2171_06035 [Clostridia bacterium]|nr:hypothetical protein [Clostridia bacterium]
MKIVTYIWKNRRIVFSAAVLFSVLFFAYSCFKTYYTETIMISLIYPNAEKGKYPDGTRFNIYDLLSDEVLQNAVDSYNEDFADSPVALSDIKNNIFAQENMAGGALSKVTEARNMGLDSAYFANEYTISCVPVHKWSLNDLGHYFGIVPYVNNAAFSEKLYSSYIDFFMQEHAEKNIVPGLAGTIDYENYDYVEIANIFEQRINMCINYLETKNAENGSFRSNQTQMSFNDLINAFRNLKNVQVKNLTAFVSSSKLAKNPEEFVNRLKVQNELYTLQYNKYKGESEVAKKAMSQYDHTFEENIIITGIGDDNELYQARPKTAYDAIAKQTLDSGVKAENLLKDIEENNKLIKLYGSAKISADERSRLCSVADKLIEEISTQNEQLVKQADTTVEEYLTQKSSDYVRKTVMPKNYLSISAIMKTGVVFVFSGMSVLVFLYSKDIRSRRAPKIRKKKVRLKFNDNMTQMGKH